VFDVGPFTVSGHELPSFRDYKTLVRY